MLFLFLKEWLKCFFFCISDLFMLGHKEESVLKPYVFFFLSEILRLNVTDIDWKSHFTFFLPANHLQVFIVPFCAPFLSVPIMTDSSYSGNGEKSVTSSMHLEVQ